MRRITSLAVFILLLVVGVYTYWYYFRPYSDGTRVGLLQKISHKGDFFKTYEGELIQEGFGTDVGGRVAAQRFLFTAKNDGVAAELEKLQGQYVKVHYVQYRRTLPWRGEDYGAQNDERGQYIVDEVAAQSTQTPAPGYPPAAR